MGEALSVCVSDGAEQTVPLEKKQAIEKVTPKFLEICAINTFATNTIIYDFSIALSAKVGQLFEKMLIWTRR